MLDYTTICMDMPKSASMVFALHVTIVTPSLRKYVFTCFTEVYSLKEQETVFLK